MIQRSNMLYGLLMGRRPGRDNDEGPGAIMHVEIAFGRFDAPPRPIDITMAIQKVRDPLRDAGVAIHRVAERLMPPSYDEAVRASGSTVKLGGMALVGRMIEGRPALAAALQRYGASGAWLDDLQSPLWRAPNYGPSLEEVTRRLQEIPARRQMAGDVPGGGVAGGGH